MTLSISASFAVHLQKPTDLLLQFEAAALPGQHILSSQTKLPSAMHVARVPAHNNVGERIWVRAHGDYEVSYKAMVEVERQVPDLASLTALAPHALPGETVEYVFDSRYCQADRMHGFVMDRFGRLDGGEKILAMRDWIAGNFRYEPGASNVFTTAIDTFVSRTGVCRDYAHVMIALARAANIPARYVSCYAPGVEPPDFHAVTEVFLADPAKSGEGAWHLVDPTGMADADSTAKIGVGRDAADVSFLTSFGQSRFDFCKVSVKETS